MDTITIPVSLASPPQPPPKNRVQVQRQKPKDLPTAPGSSGVVKKKQSKSRNGCVTCKAKRLKCDEVKPTCEQCKRRKVSCGGYKKDFKWRPFEDPGCTSKQSTQARKDTLNIVHTQPKDDVLYVNDYHPSYRYFDITTDVHQALPQLLDSSTFGMTHSISSHQAPLNALNDKVQTPSTVSQSFVTPQSVSPIDSNMPSLPGPDSCFGDNFARTGRSEFTVSSSVATGQSPRLIDLLLPGVDHCAPPEEYLSYRDQHEAFYQPTGFTPPPAVTDDDIEEIPRHFNHMPHSWSMRQSLPSPFSSSSSSSASPEHHPIMQPQDLLSSSETMSRRFHRDTCGILSVKDGPTENPWRTLIWPLARDCPALYHAIASMTSFHQSSHCPPMRIQGIDHMHTAIQALSEGLQNMRFDAAISTTLVLAFAESWDVHTSTGINHIKGAKVLINQALVQHRQIPRQEDEWKRLKFLCNTWIYMDVIAGLTSAGGDENNDVDAIYDSIHTTGETDPSLDPLMGCAHSLFPIIGRVATLIRKLRKPNPDLSKLTAQAMHLKSQLEEWTPPSYVESPEDETTSPRDSVKTATAYKFATLLYLHQAFPSLPSCSALSLAKRVLRELAAVNPSSRSSVVHIYPLMAAGCEMVKKEDRAWVVQRWELLLSRMKLGIIDKSLTVTREVWARRDAYASECKVFAGSHAHSLYPAEERKRGRDAYLDSEDDEMCSRGSFTNRRASDMETHTSLSISQLFEQEHRRHDMISENHTEHLDQEFTVKGRLHWLGVMRDWNWEVLLS